MSVNKRNNIAYGLTQGLTNVFNPPIVSSRAPTVRDQAPIGTLWVDQTNDDVYSITRSAAGVNTWINVGGGGGVFANLTVNPGPLTLTGNLVMPAGTVTVTALGRGVVQSSVAGLLSASAGTNGQVLIGGTGIAPAWASITSATLNIIPGANTLQIEYPGGVAASFVTDAGGPVVPLLGVTTVVGFDANITTDGTVANTIQIRLSDNITSVGTITSSVGFNVLTGTTTITSDTNAGNCIYLHANGGVNENIRIYSQQGTSGASIDIISDHGGFYLGAGLNAANAVLIQATSAAGGIALDSGTNGIDLTAVNGPIQLISGTGAITIGTDAAVHDVTIGSVVGASSLLLQSGTGDVVVTSTDRFTVDSVGVLDLNSSGAAINIGQDAVAQNINIGTGAAARTITIGNATGASSVIVNGGTGVMEFGNSGIAHATVIGGTAGASATTLHSGTGALTILGGGVLDIDSAGILSINSSGAVINIGNDVVAQNMNIGIGGARTITIGSGTGASSTIIDVGTGNLDLGVTATAHTTRLGSITGASATTVQSGTGDLILSGGGILTIDTVGVLELNSSAGVISIGNDAVAQAINIGNGAAARTITIGNATGATSVVVDSGTGNADFAANATAHQTRLGSLTTTSYTQIRSGTGGITMTCGGLARVEVAVDTQAGNAVTINANAGLGTFTGITTAAGAVEVFTVNNTVCTATSAIICTLANLGANDAQLGITRVIPAANSFTVTAQNFGAAACNGNVLLTFWILQA